MFSLQNETNNRVDMHSKAYSQPTTTVPKEDKMVERNNQEHKRGANGKHENQPPQGQDLQREGSDGEPAEDEDGHMQPVCPHNKSQQELIEMAFAGKACKL